MKILLSDGSGLTARQVATRLGREGHVVEVLNPTGFALVRFTRWVTRVHECPPFGADPIAWLDTALKVLRTGGFDLFIPTQEQVTVLSGAAARVHALGVRMAVPAFPALEQVQDKLSAYRTLDRVGLHQPPSRIVTSPEELMAIDLIPAFVKIPIGTASTGVTLVDDRDALRDLIPKLTPAFIEAGGVLIQQPVPGPLVMVQSVFDQGRLVAWHANLRVREGSNGGASHKRGVNLPGIAPDLSRLGEELGWHGALSLDAILDGDTVTYIDVNPRLVEPANAWLSGVDLVGALIDAALSRAAVPREQGTPDVASHQLLLSVVKAAESGRTAILRELWQAGTRTGPYRGSVEELTPAKNDPRALVPLSFVSTRLLVSPHLSRSFAGETVQRYSLSQSGWATLKEQFGNSH